MNDSRANNAPNLDAFLGVAPRGRGSRMRRALLGLLVSAIALTLIGFWLAPRSTLARYATAEIVHGDMEVSVTATGNLEPTHQVTVGSELSGLVGEVLVDVNDPVAKDRPIARLDTQRLQDTLRRSEAALLVAEAGVEQASATLAEAEANAKRLEDIRARSGRGLVSQFDVDAAVAARTRARANVASARASVLSAQAQLSSDRTNLDKATIRSPVDGVVLARNVDPGQTVAASFSAPELFVIAEDLSAMQAKVKIDEADVGQVREGLPASFTVDAWPGRVFPAEVKRVDLAATTTTSSTGASSSSVVSYVAVLDVDNGDGVLRPGMTVTATLVASRQQDVLLAPNAALRYAPSAATTNSSGGFLRFPRPPRGESSRVAAIGRGSTQTLYVLDAQQQPVPVAVTAGSSDGSRTIVSGEGLQAGMRVITGELASSQ